MNLNANESDSNFFMVETSSNFTRPRAFEFGGNYLFIFFLGAYLNVCIQNAVIKLRIFCFLYSNEFKCIIILWLSIGSDIFLHRDKNLMPQSPAAWSAWNFLGNTDEVCVTYWLNILQVIKISPFSLNR